MFNLTIQKNRTHHLILKKFFNDLTGLFRGLLALLLFYFACFLNQVSAQTTSATTSNNNNYWYNPPSCEFRGPELVCPGAANEYKAKSENLPYGYTYKWYVSGDGYIVGDDHKKSVTVKAKAECNTKYIVKLIIEKKNYYGHNNSSSSSDNSDNKCYKVVWVKSVTKPYIQCPRDITVECYKDVPSADPHSVKAWNECGGYVKVTFEGDKIYTIPYQTCAKIIYRYYKATDNCGNSTYCYQKISVNDKTPPAIICPKDITVECDKDVPVFDCNSVHTWDNCEGYVKVTFDGDKVVTDPSNSCLKTITRCYKATDKCGNSSYCYQKIIVNDKTPPTITCPKDITVECENDVPDFDCSLIKTSDNCGDYVKVTFDGDKVGTDPNNSCLKTITRCYKATDKCGNSSYCYQKIIVNDKTPPTIICPKDITVECEKDVPDFDCNSVKATDNCGGNVKITFDGDKVVTDPKNTCLKTITRCYKATDKCGNSSYGYQKIIVNDKTPPVITCPKDITVECEKDVPDFDCNSVKATDNCGGNVKITFDGDKVVTDPKNTCLKTITRCYKATDKCGNSSYGYQKIIVNDKTPPVITCPRDITVHCDKDVPRYDCSSIKATDNCRGKVTVTFEGDKVVINPSNKHIKTITRCYKAVDVCGNRSYCYQKITVDPSKEKSCGSNVSAARSSTGKITDEKALVDKTIITAYPNPYRDQLTFRIVPSISGKAVLEVYNYVGQKMGIAYNGAVFAGIEKIVYYKVPFVQRVPLMYKLTIGDKNFTGSVLPEK